MLTKMERRHVEVKETRECCSVISQKKILHLILGLFKKLTSKITHYL